MNWQAFLNYAKRYPQYIPKDSRGRSIIYQECKAGRRSDLCEAIKANKPFTPKKTYTPSTDIHLLHARIKACEEEMHRLQARISSSSSKSARTA